MKALIRAGRKNGEMRRGRKKEGRNEGGRTYVIKEFLFDFGVNLRFVFSIQFQTSIQWPTCLNALQCFRRLFTVQLQGIVNAF